MFIFRVGNTPVANDYEELSYGSQSTQNLIPSSLGAGVLHPGSMLDFDASLNPPTLYE